MVYHAHRRDGLLFEWKLSKMIKDRAAHFISLTRVIESPVTDCAHQSLSAPSALLASIARRIVPRFGEEVFFKLGS